jgi:hypothetical protein
MYDTVSILTAFFIAFLATLWILSGGCYSIHMNGYIGYYMHSRIVCSAVIALALIFHKRIYQSLKAINGYSWLIILCYLSGTMAMEYEGRGHTVPFEGFFITLPLVLAFVFWSQKNSRLLRLPSTEFSTKKVTFKIDFFLITMAFMLVGCISVLINSFVVIGEFRTVWPFLVWFISIYGALNAIAFSIIGLMDSRPHKNYTLLCSLGIIIIYSILDFTPKKFSFLNLGMIDIHYVISILLITMHFIRCLVFRKK